MRSAQPYFAEAIGLARALGDGWRLSQILSWQAFMAFMAGDPIAAREAAEEGRDLADAIGDRLDSRQCRWVLGLAQWASGDLAGAVAQLREVVAEADAAHDVFWRFNGLFAHAHALAWHGDVSAARAAANAAIERAAELSAWHEGQGYVALAAAALAAGDAAAADDAIAAGWQHISVQPAVAAIFSAYVAQAALARGDLTAARRWADDAVAATSGWHLPLALTTRARVAIAQGEPEQADRDAHEALAVTASTGAYTGAPDTFECLAALAVDAGSHHEAARLFGAARRHPAAHRRGPLQDLRRRLRSLGGGAS